MGRLAALLAIVALLGRVLAFFREQSIAVRFGASIQTDAFLAAIALPTVLSNAIASGIAQAYVPLISKLVAQHSDSAYPLLKRLERGLYLGLGGLTVTGILLAPWLVQALAPGMPDTGRTLAARLGQILFFLVFALNMAGFYKAVLDSHRRPLVSASGTLLQHTIVVIGVAWFIPRDVTWLAYVVVLGATVQWLLQASYVYRLRPKTAKASSQEAVRQGGKVKDLVLFSLAGSAYEINLVVDRVFASWLPTGALTLLAYADKLRGIPLGIMQLMLQSIGLAHVSRLRATDTAQFHFQMAQYLKLGLVAGLLATLLLSVLARPIVGLLFEHGAFTRDAANATASYLPYYAVAMLFSVLSLVLQMVLISAGQSKRVLATSLTGAAANALGNYVLIPWFGAVGIAMATTFTAGVTLLTYLLWSFKTFEHAWWASVGRDYARILAVGALAAFVMVVVRNTLGLDQWRQPVLTGAMQLALTAAVGALVYILLLWRYANLRRMVSKPSGG